MNVKISPPSMAVDIGGNTVEVSTGTPVARSIVSGSMPMGGNIGDIIMKTGSADYAAAWVTPASNAEQDNTRPITAAAVYTEIGNINALLATI